MLKKALLIFFLFFSCGAQAQVIINAQLPPAGMVQRDQLWNLVLVNNSAADINAKILLKLQDISTGQIILTGTTPNFILGKGVKVINSRDVQPIQYTYSSTGPASNYLPLGSYLICYGVYKNIADASEKVVEECIRLNISPLNPPLLATPLNNSTLSTPFPQFTWIAPAPLDMFSDLNYELNVTEVLAGQSATQAMLYNSPIYTKTNSRVTYEIYPSSYSKLEKGKTYAWQITARNGQSYSAYTDVWAFSIAKDSISSTVSQSSYLLLKNNIDDAGFSYVTDTLRIKYYSFDQERNATVRFLTPDGQVVEEKKAKVIYGDNFLTFKISNRFQKDRTYIIEIFDEQNKIHTALFTIKN